MLVSALLVLLLPRLLDPALPSATLQLWLLNALPLLVLWFGLLGLSGRPLLAAALTSFFAGIFYGVNLLKLRNLELPLMPGDLAVARQLATSPELYVRYLTPGVLWLLVPLLALLALWRIEKVPVFAGARWARLGLVLLAMASLSGIVQGWWPWTAWYDGKRLATSLWMPRQSAERLGTLALFVQLFPQAVLRIPPPDPQALAEFDVTLGAAHRERLTTPPTDERPDLIVIQSESFFDPSRLVGVDGAPYLANYHRLRALGRHGDLTVPAFGGLTTRTEFELLTGFPLATLPQVQYPYQALVHHRMPALPWTLKQLGYATRALHPYERRFYRRDRVYPLLGFDSFHSLAEFDGADYHGHYISDAAMTRRLVELLEHGSPQFVFAVSMENHGPWDATRPVAAESLAAIEVPSSLAPAEAHTLRLFLHHARQADAALGELADWVLTREQPTVLLFFGDHLPALADVYARLGFVDGRHEVSQPVPWLLLDNRAPVSERRDLGSHQLAALLLDAAGINHDPLFVAASLLREAGDAIAPNRRLALQGELARAHLQAEISVPATELRTGHIARVVAWGPASAEVVAAGEAESPELWVKFADEVPRSAHLRLAGRRLDSGRSSPTYMFARVQEPLRPALLADPGELPLELVDPLAGLVQPIGRLDLRSRAERLRVPGLAAPSRFCAIEGWGPEHTSRREPTNRQPDGSTGLWARAACLPPQARFLVGEYELETQVDDRLATTRLPLALMQAGQTLPVALLDPDNQARLPLGDLRIDD